MKMTFCAKLVPSKCRCSPIYEDDGASAAASRERWHCSPCSRRSEKISVGRVIFVLSRRHRRVQSRQSHCRSVSTPLSSFCRHYYTTPLWDLPLHWRLSCRRNKRWLYNQKSIIIMFVATIIASCCWPQIIISCKRVRRGKRKLNCTQFASSSRYLRRAVGCEILVRFVFHF